MMRPSFGQVLKVPCIAFTLIDVCLARNRNLPDYRAVKGDAEIW
jgi:hypothetical protein